MGARVEHPGALRLGDGVPVGVHLVDVVDARGRFAAAVVLEAKLGVEEVQAWSAAIGGVYSAKSGRRITEQECP